jgi:hypothetical protein
MGQVQRKPKIIGLGLVNKSTGPNLLFLFFFFFFFFFSFFFSGPAHLSFLFFFVSSFFPSPCGFLFPCFSSLCFVLFCLFHFIRYLLSSCFPVLSSFLVGLFDRPVLSLQRRQWSWCGEAMDGAAVVMHGRHEDAVVMSEGSFTALAASLSGLSMGSVVVVDLPWWNELLSTGSWVHGLGAEIASLGVATGRGHDLWF